MGSEFFVLFVNTSPQASLPLNPGDSFPITQNGAPKRIPAAQLLPQFSAGTAPTGILTGANFNSTSDQPIPLVLPASGRALVYGVLVSNPSVALPNAIGGIYAGAGKTGAQIVPATQPYYGLTTNADNADGNALWLSGPGVIITVSTLYLSLSIVEGAPATADVRIFALAL